MGRRLDVPLDAPGAAHRNHRPHCLTGRHVDGRTPGDRAAGRGGRMAALSLSARADGEWMVIHQCLSCGELSVNRIAGDDNALALVRLAVGPLRDTTLAHRVLLALWPPPRSPHRGAGRPPRARPWGRARRPNR